MSKLNNFGPIYIINLPDNKKRLIGMQNQLKMHKIKDYKVIEAVDGRKNDLSEIIYGEYPNLKPSEIGCIASHIKAIKYWLETSNSEYAVIMEDDCSFDTVKYWQWDWNYVINNLPKNADIIQLVMIQNDDVKFNMHKKEQFKYKKTNKYAWSTACYLIKRSYAQKIIKNLTYKNKLNFNNINLKNKAADVTLYNLGNAYSMPLFTYFMETKSAINSGHQDFHKRSKQFIDTWWKNKSHLYLKESFFDIRKGLSKKMEDADNICYNIFHVDGTSHSAQKRNILTRRAKIQLLDSFDEITTPTIIIKNFEDVKNFYCNEDIVIDPKGHKGNGWKFGELGVWASNYSAWKNFSKTKYEMLMLMEDDIKLDKNFNSKLLSYIKELPDDWDFFTVYTPSFGNVRYKSNKKDLDIGKENICKVYQSWSCLCYLVSKKGTKKLLKLVKKPVSSPIDHWLFYHQELNGYAIKLEKGNICDIYKTQSTIQSAEKYDMTGYV